MRKTTDTRPHHINNTHFPSESVATEWQTGGSYWPKLWPFNNGELYKGVLLSAVLQDLVIDSTM